MKTVGSPGADRSRAIGGGGSTRYRVTGWGDRVESLSYLGSFMHLLLFLVAAAVGYLI